MNKKFRMICILALIVLMVVPATLTAAGFLGLQIGPTAKLSQNFTLEMIEDPDLPEFTLDDLVFGLDARLNVSILEAAVNAEYLGTFADITEDYPVWEFAGMDGVVLSTFISGGISLDLLGLLDVAVTAGPRIYVLAGPEIGIMPYTEFELAPLMVRSSIDLNLGGLAAGVFVLVDPKVTLGELMEPGFVYAPGSEPTAQVGATVLFRLL